MAGEGSRCARPETRANLFSIATFIFHRFYATGWEADFGLVMWRATNLSFTLVMAVVPQGSSTIASCRSRRLDSPASCKGTSANWLWLRAVRRPSFGTLRKICLGTVEPKGPLGFYFWVCLALDTSLFGSVEGQFYRVCILRLCLYFVILLWAWAVVGPFRHLVVQYGGRPPPYFWHSS